MMLMVCRLMREYATVGSGSMMNDFRVSVSAGVMGTTSAVMRAAVMEVAFKRDSPRL